MLLNRQLHADRRNQPHIGYYRQNRQPHKWGPNQCQNRRDNQGQDKQQGNEMPQGQRGKCLRVVYRQNIPLTIPIVVFCKSMPGLTGKVSTIRIRKNIYFPTPSQNALVQFYVLIAHQAHIVPSVFLENFSGPTTERDRLDLLFVINSGAECRITHPEFVPQNLTDC